VLITVYWHTRSAREMVKRYGARVWASSRGRAAVARRAGKVTDPFRPGDELPGAVEAFGTARSSEVVYWLPEHGALCPGDVLLGDGAGGIRLCPASWLPQGVGQAKLRESLHPLLDLPVERVLLSHGTPVLADGWRALARAIAR
jgi:glyoxylase-like metal-dependent hydrolase (beta-lactamase superfamily II)